MKLRGIGQDISLEGETQNYLDFLRDDGTTFRLPVSEESVKLLIAEIYKKQDQEQQSPVAAAYESEPVEQHATEFGGNGSEEEEQPEGYVEESLPQSESEVPSL
jgi:hypothetical protein